MAIAVVYCVHRRRHPYRWPLSTAQKVLLYPLNFQQDAVRFGGGTRGLIGENFGIVPGWLGHVFCHQVYFESCYDDEPLASDGFHSILKL